MPHTKPLLSVKGLKKYFPLSKSSFFSRTRPMLHAVEDIYLDIFQGETLGLVGESGCGKSTLGRNILGLQKPTAGRVLYCPDQTPVDLTALSPSKMRKYRKDLQIVFQDPYSSLNPRMTVGQLIEEGIAAHKFYRRGSAEMQNYVVEIMQKCGLQPYMLHRYPHQFSGGQRQRIGIARALALRPKFVVLDECVSALDVSVQSQILNLLTDLKEKEGLTYLFISHDLGVVRHVSDRIAVMYLGRIVETGSAKQVFSDPRHPYTVALISAIPSPNNRRKIFLDGALPNPTSPPQGCPFHTRCFMAKEICRRIVPPQVEIETGHVAACHFAQKSGAQKRSFALRQQAEKARDKALR